MDHMPWTNKITLSFINDVRNCPILWDPSDPHFRVLKKKNEAWSRIAREYNTTAFRAKSKWLSLQGSFRREKLRDGSSRWFAFRAMSFMKDRSMLKVDKNTTQKPDTFDKSEYVSNDYDPACMEMNVVVDGDMKIENITTSDVGDDYFSGSPSKSTKIESSLFPRTLLAKRNREDAGSQEFWNTRNTTVLENVGGRDENEIYGEYVATTLKKLDSHARIVAKHYINGILFDAELGRYKDSFPPEKTTLYFD